VSTLSSLLKTSVACISLAVLAACGGGGDTTAPAAAPLSFVSQMRAHALAAPPARAVSTDTTTNTTTVPAAQALAMGRWVTATYAVTGLSTGQYTADTVIDGPASFQNQNAVKVTTRTTGTETTAGVTTVGGVEIASYEQDAGNGFVRHLGSEIASIVQGAVVGRSVVVNTPPVVNVE